MSDDSNGSNGGSHGPNGSDPTPPTLLESLLPYDRWFEEAQRDVMLKALEYVSWNGLPGEHHFYLTFLTAEQGVVIPPHLRKRFPDEMTIILQHQFRDLSVDRNNKALSVGLSFGGVPTTLRIPFQSIVAFADPYLQLMLRFSPSHLSSHSAEDKTDAAPTESDQSSELQTTAELHRFSDTSARKDGPNTADAPSAPSHVEGSTSGEERKEAEIVSLESFRKRPTSPSEGSK